MDPNASPTRRYLATLAPVAVFAIAIVTLHRLGGEFHLRDILAEFAAIEGWQVAAGVLLAAGSYFALTGYERLALEYVGKSLSWKQYGLTSFVAYAVGHNVGVAALSGGAVRYRMYSPLGLGAGEIARIVAFCTVTFALGVATLPFMVNRLTTESRRLVKATALIAVSKEAFFEFHVTHWLGTPTGGLPTLPELEKAGVGAVLCVYGSDEKDSPCHGLTGPNLRKVLLPGGHHFDGDYGKVAQSMLSALPP